MNAIAIAVSIPIFFALIGVEAWVAARRGARLFRLQDSVNSLGCGIVQQATSIVLKGFVVGGYFFVHEYFAIFSLEESPLVWLALFFLVDHQYYWFHRASHRVNFVWATHVVHHQSEDYNLTTALRQSALQGVLSAPFYWPLALLGFPPLAFVAMSTANTLYQFWIHTRLVGKLGPLEWVLNTPSHHRVHHGIDPEYIDKNYAGILIVWDRLYGTFIEERREPAYGTVKPLASWNVLWANAEQWARCWRVAQKTARLRDKLWIWVAPPEWLPEDLGGTVTIPEVDHETRARYEVRSSRALDGYVAASFAATGVAVAVLLVGYDELSLAHVALASWIVASATAWGALLEQKRWAVPLEAARLVATGPLVWALAWGSDWAAIAGVAALVGSIASLGWLVRVMGGPRLDTRADQAG